MAHIVSYVLGGPTDGLLCIVRMKRKRDVLEHQYNARPHTSRSSDIDPREPGTLIDLPCVDASVMTVWTADRYVRRLVEAARTQQLLSRDRIHE